MKYVLAIYGSLGTSQSGLSALAFAHAVLDAGHSIILIFFYHDGVHHASALVSPPQDELNLPEQWQDLIDKFQLDAVVCIAAALRRGIINNTESERYELPASNLRDCYHLSGLGQFLEAIIVADRLIIFGD